MSTARIANPVSPQLRAGLDHYQVETRRPIVSLVFVLPLILVYELGVILLDNESMRNGVDIWMRRILDMIGAGQIFILPVLIAVILLAAHHIRKDRWGIRWTVLAGMVIESIALAVILFFAAKAQRLFFIAWEPPGMAMSVAGPGDWGTNLLAFLGAGLYEELVFRLILLAALIKLCQLALRRPTMSMITAIAATSLVFALLHYFPINPAGTHFQWPGFTIRVMASVFFCVVFLYRGFGIAVGTHAAYDVMTQL